MKATYRGRELRDVTSEWTYRHLTWRQGKTMQQTTFTKEQLAREIADWVKRAQHEAKLAFAEGDLWTALAWGSKVPDLLEVAKDLRALPFQVGADVTRCYDRMDAIVREIDACGRIKALFPKVNEVVFGIDMAKGSGQAIATLFAVEMDRLGRESRRILDSAIIKGPLEEDLERFGAMAPTPSGLTDEQLRARVRERLDVKIGGKPFDSVIIDDPYKE